MTATAHALIGASIATKVINPVAGIPLAIISHYIADFIPHWDSGTNHRKKSLTRLRWEAVVDVCLGFALSYLIFSSVVSPVYLFVMIISAQLPDWIGAPSFMFQLKSKFPPLVWTDWLSHNLQSRMQLPWGLVTQIVTVGVMIILAFGGPASLGQALAARF